MASGFVYACCRRDAYSAVKIGFTTQDPHAYCNNLARTLCPLEVIRIDGFANARLAESNIFYLLHAVRCDPKHEVFNLSKDKNFQGLDRAFTAAHDLDCEAGLPVPLVPSVAGESLVKRKKERLYREEHRPLNKEDLEFRQAAKDFARRQKHHELSKEKEEARVVRMKRKREEEAALVMEKNMTVTNWLSTHLKHTGSDEDFVKRSCLYNQYKDAVVDLDQLVVSSKHEFFQHLLATLGKQNYRKQHRRHNKNSKGVFVGWRQVGHSKIAV